LIIAWRPDLRGILRDLRHPACIARSRRRRAQPGEATKPAIAHRADHDADPDACADTQSGENEEARQLYTAGRYYSTREQPKACDRQSSVSNVQSRLDPSLRCALGACRLLRVAELVRRAAAAGAWERAKESALRAVERIRICLRRTRRSVCQASLTIAIGSTPNASCAKRFN
jgi:hypothetical protein